MNYLELKIPPVLVLLIAAILIYIGRDIRILFDFPFLPISLSITLFLIGTLVILAGVCAFKSAKTTVDPRTPEKASNLVQNGIFNFTRNPMYLGMAVMLSAVTSYYPSLFSLFILISFIAYITVFQILPEESYMKKMFNSKYQTYCARVRRWI